jgi:hypothetical protein
MTHKFIKQAMPLLLLTLGLQQAAWAEDAPKAEAKPAAEAAKITLPDSGCSLETLAGSYNWDESTRTDYSKDGYNKFGAGWVHAVSVGREVNDGKGKITAGQMTINDTFDGKIKTHTYTGVVTVEPSCVGTYRITLEDGASGGGGTIYIDPVSKNFTLLDEFNIGTARFLKDGSSGK